MRRFRFLYAGIFVLGIVCSTAYLANLLAPLAHAQTTISGALAGTVTDPSGAAVAGAQVTATSQETGAKQVVTTSATGGYSFSLLQPGHYLVQATMSGFKATTAIVRVGIGQIATQNLQLSLGEAVQTVEVTAAPQLLQTESAELSSQVNFQQLQNIPNPGSDITYAAQSHPGVVMNTGANSSSGTLGYGNFSVFGLPGTSNNFTVNGMEVNDPFLNLNNSGPSNLLLGLNDIQETDVITNAYEAQYGSFGGVQLNSVSRSGGNQFHGNLIYAWNGRAMNANDWYNKNPQYNQTPVGRPFSNFNQWAGAVGGPILRNKLFFFFNTEGISFITASQNVVYMPDQAFQTSVLGNDGACDNNTSSLFNATQPRANSAALAPGSTAPATLPGNPSAPGECAFYQRIFNLYNGTPNHAAATENPNQAGQLQLSVPSRFNLTEKLITARIDGNIGPNDKAFGHFKYDHGVQPTYTDPINSAFNAQSNQPDYEGQFAETHTFGVRAVNQFLMTGSWYSAIFNYVNTQKALSTFPFELSWYDGFANDLNNNGISWPEGRNATQYQLGDDFSYTIGRHTLRTGVAFKKDDISDYDTGILTVPYVFSDATYNSPTGDAFDTAYPSDFQTGQSILGLQQFPTNLDLPLSLYTLGFYVQDDWKAMDKLTLTMGIRVERNSNVSCGRNCLSNFGGNFFSLAATAPLNTSGGAYNQQIKYNLKNAFTSYQPFMVEPRLGFSYAVDSKTVLRGGFGIFTDVFPGTIADSMLNNPPLTMLFQIGGAAFGGPMMPLNPTIGSSFQGQAAGANTTFQSQFKTGGSYNSMLAANPNFSAPSFTTVAAKLHYPTYDEWNLQVQRQFGRFDSMQIGYVGNHGYHEPNQNVGVNAYGGYGLTGVAPSFGQVTEVESEASSNYNGLIVSYLHQGQGLNVQLNYQWSHALDEISNGGILPFSSGSINYQIDPYNLGAQYGNADYDVRHYFSGNYLYQMPHFGGPKELTGGWQLGGTVYVSTGNPFSPSQYISDFGIQNFGNGHNITPLIPKPGISHHCTASAANPTSPCFTSSDFMTSTGPFGNFARNQFFGPHFVDTDMTLLKAFGLPKLGEQGNVQIGLTAFNVFNHPNFGLPHANIDSPSTFGTTTYAEGPPTSIYGSGVGGDPSVRIVELNARFNF